MNQKNTISNSLNELSHSFPYEDNPFSLEDLRWQHFEFNNETNKVIAERDRVHLVRKCAASVGLKDASVLELGPYEGYDTKALEAEGVSEIISIEGNPRNFIKCLIVKNKYGLNKTKYLLGDFTKYLDTTTKKFDYIHASGVLYHLFDPFSTLEKIVALTDNIGICTTYYHSEIQGFNFTGKTKTVNLAGLEPLTLHERTNPQITLGKKHGMDDIVWMFTKEDLLRYLKYKGFDCEIIFDVADKETKRLRIQIIAQR